MNSVLDLQEEGKYHFQMPDLFYKLQRHLCFSKGNPSNPLVFKPWGPVGDQLHVRDLQNSPEDTYVMLKNHDVHSIWRLIRRKLIKNE